MRDPFKILNKTEEKSTKKLEQRALEGAFYQDPIVWKGFELIPPKAFESIYDNPGMEYLKDGLWVGNTQMLIDDTIRMANDLILESTGLEGAVQFRDDEFMLSGLPWYQAKMLTHSMGAKLPTPAEFFLTYDYLINNAYGARQDSMLLNMSRVDAEWLDAVVVSNKMHLNASLIDNKILSSTELPKFRIENLDGSTQKYFNLSDIDMDYGLPRTVHSNGNHHILYEKGDFGHLWYQVKESEIAIAKTSVPKKSVKKPGLNMRFSPDWSSNNMSIRFCYKVRDGDHERWEKAIREDEKNEE